jgi:hypothetical protein
VRERIELAQPRSFQERREIAEICAARLSLSAPVLLDGMQNAASHAYQAWPERLYVVSREGTIAYQGGRGPYGFDPDELARFLKEYLGPGP